MSGRKHTPVYGTVQYYGSFIIITDKDTLELAKQLLQKIEKEMQEVQNSNTI